MPKFPEPPADLATLPPHLLTLPAGTELWRLYCRGGDYATTWSAFRAWGPAPGARFDHQVPPPRRQTRMILHAAAQSGTCIAEVFQQTRVIDVAAGQPWLASFPTQAELTLLDLTGRWPTAAGASMAINSGPRTCAQRWSRAIYDAYPQVQGLWYCSSMDANRPALALYERSATAVPPAPSFHRALVDPLLLVPLRNLAHDLNYRLV